MIICGVVMYVSCMCHGLMTHDMHIPLCSQYKREYSVLISEVEKIKAEMSTVKVKVDRSVNLLQNLSHERSRWEGDSASFQSQIATVVGDCLLSAGRVIISYQIMLCHRSYHCIMLLSSYLIFIFCHLCVQLFLPILVISIKIIVNCYWVRPSHLVI